MSTTTPSKVEFLQYNQDVMENGIYDIEVEQTITSSKIDPQLQPFTCKMTFVVSGERFGPLSPSDIYAVFPPQDSLGEHHYVVPHITLKRSTLPWERFPGTSDEELPWLVLLLLRETDFDNEQDKPKLQSLTLKDLLATPDSIKFPQITLELGGQHEQEAVTVIDVKKKYLQPVLPTKADLAYLAHARQPKDAEGNPQGEQLATILSNRLPEPQGLTTAYLVSVEGRYQDDGTFDYMGAGDDDLIRLVSLTSWSFGCIDPEQSFSKLVQRLNRTPSSLELPPTTTEADNFLKMGFVPVPHSLREGSKTVSWYRSPLTPGNNPDTFPLPVRAADELVRYDSATGLFDSSYAAAWQVGRMLTLQNQRLATELFNWKRENAQFLLQLQQEAINRPLRSQQFLAETPTPTEMPEAIDDWFSKLELLQGVPFNYLVPDERLLPTESIRFFWVDSFWVDCLQDGAFSVGRVTAAQSEQDKEIRSLPASKTLSQEKPLITGLILRSQVVSGWPNLLIDGYDAVVDSEDFVAPSEAQLLQLLRMEKLAKDVLICLFKGEVKTVDIHLQPEAMHFGLDIKNEATNEFWQILRNADGEEMDGDPNPLVAVDPIPWKYQEKGVIDIKALVEEMKKKKDELNLGDDLFTSAQFALQMIEGVQKIRFTWE